MCIAPGTELKALKLTAIFTIGTTGGGVAGGTMTLQNSKKQTGVQLVQIKAGNPPPPSIGAVYGTAASAAATAAAAAAPYGAGGKIQFPHQKQKVRH